ncbi:MAG: prolyl oligopeptidase family serine peptidase, partial [Bacteroidia bacterium]|nr:prolyl oligopeptidase family serine peptidase [Bacteroidia bacterium]
SDYDDRVPPLHSYKMVAQMQALASPENPVLLRVEKNAGHNGSKGYQNYLDETTDFYTFLYNALGLLKK